MSTQDDNEYSEALKIFRNLLQISQAGVHDQIAGLRGDVTSVEEGMAQLKARTEGAVDSGVRLAAEAESKAFEVSERLQELVLDVERQKAFSASLFALCGLNSLAVSTMAVVGVEEFIRSYASNYVKQATIISSLAVKSIDSEIQDLPDTRQEIQSAMLETIQLLALPPEGRLT